MCYGARIFAASEKKESQISAEMVENLFSNIKPMNLLRGFGKPLLWNKLVGSWYLFKLLDVDETLEVKPKGEAKRAQENLIKMGLDALPSLMAKNARLIDAHQTYCEWLKSGASQNPYENHIRKSDVARRHRYNIEIKQARVVEVIKQIKKNRLSEYDS